MTVGLPGTGIGGMFYLLSALAMPVREAGRRLRGAAAGSWRLVAGQTAITGGIIAGMWGTGWLLGLAVRTAHPVLRLAAHPHAGNALRIAALLLSVGTLAGVLLAVELARLWVRRHPLAPQIAPPAAEGPEPRLLAAGGSGRAVARLVLLVLAGSLVAPRRAAGQGGSAVRGTLARADSAFAHGHMSLATREYAAVLAEDSANSRALYRLGQLHRDDPALALRLFQRYVALEPRDPWGPMAVGDALADAGRYDEALRAYDAALRLAPTERDAVLGRARVLSRARRTEAAIAAYEEWVVRHPADVEAWRALAREDLRAGRPAEAARALERAQALAPDPATARRLALARAAAAPDLTPLVDGSRDSDGNTMMRLGGTAELAERGGVVLGATASRERVANGPASTGLANVALRTAWGPSAALRIDATGGVTRPDGIGAGGAPLIPTGELRARWRASGVGPALELRAQRTLLDATPELVANRVLRTELGSVVELPVAGPVKVRGIGRYATLGDSAEQNERTTLAGVVAVAATPAVELSAQVHELRYAHASAAGYFAPRLAQVVEAGSYVEVETPRGVLLSFDVGAGVQRVAAQGAAVGPWRRALSLYSLIVAPLAPGRDLRLELDAEDSPIALETAAAGQWRYLSAALSLRWALP